MKKFALSAILLATLTSCSSVKEVAIKSEPVKIKVQHPVFPEKLDPLPIEIYVVNEDTLEDFLAKIRGLEGELAFVAFQVKGYENLSINYQDMFRYIKQQREIILYYKKVTS